MSYCIRTISNHNVVILFLILLLYFILLISKPKTKTALITVFSFLVTFLNLATTTAIVVDVV